MALLAFEPESDIERKILEVQAGKYPADALIREIADSDLFIPSKSEVQEDGRGFVPVLVEQGDMLFVAVFTAHAHRPPDIAKYLLRANGRAFFPRIPAGYGVIVNPGYDAQLLLPPSGVATLKQDLRQA
jgi:SseB protein N-terminal domain